MSSSALCLLVVSTSLEVRRWRASPSGTVGRSDRYGANQAWGSQRFISQAGIIFCAKGAYTENH